MTTRSMTADDAAWAAALMEGRRIEYEQYAPVFWRPAVDITALHAMFLESQIVDPNVIALRTNSGFAIATLTGPHYYIDDFAVADGDWVTTGAILLEAAQREAEQRGGTRLRVVTAKLDTAKVNLLTAHGFELSEQWWVRAVEPGLSGAAVARDDLEIVETTAPIVYDPGGPIGILTNFSAALVDAITAARARGLVLLVAPTPANDPREAALAASGFAIASQFYVDPP